MTTNTEDRLRASLARQAADAPQVPESWDPTLVPHPASADDTVDRKPWLVAAAACLIVVGSLMAFTRRDVTTPIDVASPPSENEDSSVVPPGEEVVLIQADETGPARHIVRPGSLYRFEIVGHPDNLVYDHLFFDWSTGSVARFTCHEENGSAGCGESDADYALSANFSQTSSRDNGYADTDLVSWIGLPDEVAYVTYEAAAGPQWLRPVGGAAIFVHDVSNSMTALDVAGNVLATFPDLPVDRGPLPQAPFWNDLPDFDQDGASMLEALAQDTLRSCLDDNGATWAFENVPSFETQETADQVWAECEAEVVDAVETLRDELGLPSPTR